MRYRPLYKCHGGKFYISDFIISKFIKNYEQFRYCESCVGGASITLNKKRSISEVINDADPKVANLYKFLIDEPDMFMSMLENTQYDEATFINAKNFVQDDSGEAAIAELCVRRMSRGGLKKSFSWSTRLRNNLPGDLNAFNTFKEHAHYIALRLQGVEVENLDIKEFLIKYNQEDVFVYCDPPYLPSTRKATKAYDYEMTEKEHAELCDLLQTLKSKVLLSGYYSPLYMKKLKDWNFYTLPVVNHSGQTKKKEMRIECAWTNY